MRYCCLVCAACFCLAATEADASDADRAYAELVADDAPLVWWRFGDDDGDRVDRPFPIEATGKVVSGEGPRPPLYPAFEADNMARWFAGDGTYLRVADTPVGETHRLQFRQGDPLTLEAWVNVTKLGSGQQMYIVGKGRTKNPVYPAENQNYALRLSGANNQAVVSFLFRSQSGSPKNRSDYHRWNTTGGFAVNSGWHHVALTYEFGEPESIRGYVDGKGVNGKWDFGGATTSPPVVDDDELWIGSSLGGNPSSTFHGGIDEVAIYRRIVPPERMAARFRAVAAPSYQTSESRLVANQVLVEIFHGIPDTFDWEFPFPEPFERYTQSAWSLVELPQFYNPHGVRADRGNPVVVRLSGRVAFSPGANRLLLRSRSAARVYVDGVLVAENKHPTRGSGAHGPIYEVVSSVSPHIRPLQPGDAEQEFSVLGTGRPQLLSVDIYVGGKKRRPELGEMCLALGDAEGRFNVLTYAEPIPLTDTAWEAWYDAQQAELVEINRQRRQRASGEYARYWEQRHQDAQICLAAQPPLVLPPRDETLPAYNDIDLFLNVRLAEAKIDPLPLTDDFAFLRRICLDTIGTIPTPEVEKRYFAMRANERRARIADWLLEQPCWADHWVAYWQDVLAENPNLVNPTLNNSGPFRYWLHESFGDNKPFDRFATELILMEGSTHYGGPAGFGVATQNDSPMAAKAHILAQAFLGMEMKCARCHDAPFHDFDQRDLFSIAAMLKRGPENVPKSSTVPGDENALKSLMINVTLKPGEAIPPEWPFAEKLAGNVSPDILEQASDRREQLAALVTSPENRRFAQVAVNRLWKRYFGLGLVEPVDDWESPDPSHPQLLDYLERELIGSGYDLKHVARLIFNSHAYQRQPAPRDSADPKLARLFAGPAPRRLSAEQLVDSLFTAAGKRLRTEELNIDVDGLRNATASLNFGFPSRAWQFTSLSNERDRPSLSLPASQTIIDVLESFGWRATRPDPISIRPEETTVLQPAILANGVVAKRVAQLSDDSRLTELALQDLPLDEFISGVYRAILSRPPISNELALMSELLGPGYAERRRLEQPARQFLRPRPTGVSWTNHLRPEANERKTAFAVEVAKGDPPTERLVADWRERAEDMVWALVNSPEFVFVP